MVRIYGGVEVIAITRQGRCVVAVGLAYAGCLILHPEAILVGIEIIEGATVSARLVREAITIIVDAIAHL